MFSSTRLYTFVCLALGIAVGAAPTSAPGSNLDTRSPDVYDLTGGIGAFLLGYPEGYAGGDEDAYILKRQLAGLIGPGVETTVDANLPNINLPIKRDLYDLTGGIGALIFGVEGGESGEGSDEYILKRQLPGPDFASRLGSNMGIQHAAALASGADLTAGAAPVGSIPKRDLYDLTGGIGALLFGGDIEGGQDSDEYILKRDLYDLTGGIGALLFGGEAEGGEGSDAYILKRQLVAQLIGLSIGDDLLKNAASPVIAPNVTLNAPRDVYDTTGGIGALLFGGEGYGGEGDEDTYILKRQLPDIDVGSRLGSNMGLQHAIPLAETGLGLAGNVETATKRDTYDLTGGLGALLLGLPEAGYPGDGAEDTYILKRQVPDLDFGSRLGSNMGIQHAVPLAEAGLGLAGNANSVAARDTYDLTGGIGALLFGEAGGYGGEDEDTYIL